MPVFDAASISTASELTLDGLLHYASDLEASDIFLKTDSTPGLKIHGRIVKSTLPMLTAADAERLASTRMTDTQKARFDSTHELNLSFTLPGLARIRQNVYQERDNVATTCRLIPLRIRSLAEIGVFSSAVVNLTSHHSGLVLVTGPTGSGKSTTLAGMIKHINDTRAANIITMEDPVEYIYADNMAMISQRQIGIDTESYAEALKQVLRQTPDVILIGELRDLETLNVALQAAETGHLVFATMHTSSANETLDRVANMYPPHERATLWLRLSATLRGVVSQRLAKRQDGKGRVVVQEILVTSPSVASIIEECRPGDLYAAIRQDGIEGFWGMQTMNQSLQRAVASGAITDEEALSHSTNATELRHALRHQHFPEAVVAEQPDAPAVGLNAAHLVSAPASRRVAAPPPDAVEEPEEPASGLAAGLAAGAPAARPVRVRTETATTENPFVLRRRE